MLTDRERLSKLLGARPETLAAVDNLLMGKPEPGAKVSGTKLMTKKEAAAFLGISRATVYRLIARGQIKTFELLPGTHRIRRDDLERFVEGRGGGASNGRPRRTQPQRQMEPNEASETFRKDLHDDNNQK